MQIKTICEKCGKEFIGDGTEVKRTCIEHEVLEHFNAKVVFKERLEEVLCILDKHYKTETSYLFKDLSIYMDYCGSFDNISYYFNISNNNLSKDCVIVVYDYTKIPSITEIREHIEKYFKSNVKKYYEGIVQFEDFCGGDGADDYILDGQYMRDIFKELKGKKIKITIVE